MIVKPAPKVNRLLVSSVWTDCDSDSDAVPRAAAQRAHFFPRGSNERLRRCAAGCDCDGGAPSCMSFYRSSGIRSGRSVSPSLRAIDGAGHDRLPVIIGLAVDPVGSH